MFTKSQVHLEEGIGAGLYTRPDASPDDIVHERDRVHDAQRDASDIASAQAKDRQRLADEQSRLAALEVASAIATTATAAARETILDARVAGADDAPARANAARAEQQALEADRELGLQRQIVQRLHERLIASVRAEQVATAEAHRAEARERWGAALARAASVYEAIAALDEAHRLDLAAADELAYARSEWRLGYDADGLRERLGTNGKPYAQTTPPNLAIVLDGETVLTAGELVARLRAKG